MEWTKFFDDLLLGTSPLFLMLFILCKIHYDNKWGIDDWTFWYGSREEIKALKEKKSMNGTIIDKIWLDGKKVTLEELSNAVRSAASHEKAYVVLFSVDGQVMYFSTEFKEDLKNETYYI